MPTTVDGDEVRFFMASSDSDLPLYVGGYAEVRTADRTQVFRGFDGRWSPTGYSAADLTDLDFTLLSECGPDDFAELDPELVPALLHGVEQVALARCIATEAHEGQFDKNHEQYIDHPRRVAARLEGLQEQAVAWLHDVVEDAAAKGWTAERLLAEGVDQAIVDRVLLCTRRAEQAPEDTYAAIAADPVARAVKLADIADNTDPARTARLDAQIREQLAEKYRKARSALGAEEAA